MGNTESNVTSGVKKQTDTSSILLYKLVDLKGGGLLVDMMKRAAQTKQFAELDHAMRTKVEPFLYNKGRGKWIPISKLVLLRNKERPRHKMLPVLRAMENPGEYDIDKDLGDEEIDEDKIDKSKYREVCWSLSERGAVGETILHLCMLNATAIHADLAKRLLRFYPKLINDIYISDEYYGENVLHIAIVNEDPAMVKFLLDSGADVHERCFGNFMCPEDQKASRADSVEHEWVCVAPETNYKGYVYWGEYPLSFAACLGQEECYRLMLARGADPDKQDTNGNTVLHMLVIYQKLATFDMAYEVGASLAIRNVQFLTPLTLAAKLARIEMFFHILNIEREIYWQIGSITCAAYPLSLIDTIDIATGRISNNSALNLVVFGDKDEHLELMDGVLVDLLNAKWNTFVKSRFYRQYFLFCFYFLISLVSFTLRPGPVTKATPTSSPLSLSTVEEISKLAKNLTTSLASNITSLVSISPGAVNWLSSQIALNITSSLEEILVALLLRGLSSTESTVTEISSRSDENFTTVGENVTTGFDYLSTAVYSILSENTTFFGLNWTISASDVENEGSWWNVLTTECRLMDVTGSTAKVRLVAEILMELGAILYIAAALREARFLGLNMFIENLMTAPSRVMFLFACAILLSFPILRLTCADEVEDMLAVVVMLTLAPYFLFFCRGFKTVGPFVVMIYRMIMGDLLRFVSIYMVFVMGFSQAYYIIFLSFNKNGTEPDNPVPSPMESIMAMFLMSMTNFGDYYGAFENTHHKTEAKCLFVVYMAIVAILLVNMLIAMMGNTYQKIAETRNEWQRQWARIVLVVERGVSPTERLKKLMDYSQPMSDGRRALVLRLNQSEADKEEMKEILEMKRVHDRLVKKRKEQIHQNEMKKSSTQANSVLGKDLHMNDSVA
ncbi:transient receptor potential cation channel subfamily V member 5 isoform X1 [Neodiprion pinetum]|uniref:Transient receptor potential cation channel subfamily V member 5 n=2 Tax=Neodiprion TaxID=270857 RepID=A0A6J0C1V6_NEOLC|nr:transient receptor potential cation channel subfamily V member 5 [Neodiprion lecontei]XP_046474998.1 transient receptor potential cation channel subfamily V member 5 [Neodiprion pinetum]XP_046611969.1 transient receptor potential cation channel subfamily V member 5 [Neodiprion virginianus]